MKIVYAYYGVSCANGHLRPNVQHISTNWAAGLCNGRSSCGGTVHTSILGDPYYGCPKDFIVVAKCDGNVIANLVPKEAQGRQFYLACNYYG